MASNSAPNLAVQPEVQPNEGSQASSPQPAAPAAAFGLRRFLWPVLCFLQLGLLIGMGIVWMRSGLSAEPSHQPTRGNTQRPTKELPDPEEPEAALPQPGDLARADQLLRGSWYQAALAIRG